MKVALDRADYFELKSLIGQIAAVELEALRAVERLRAQKRQAEEAVDAKLAALAEAHGFDAKATWQLDDAGLALVGADGQ